MKQIILSFCHRKIKNVEQKNDDDDDYISIDIIDVHFHTFAVTIEC